MSFLFRTLKLALHAFRRNIMRSGLTALGIIIGVGAVIAMDDIGQGARSSVTKTIKSMGANNLLIMPGTASSGGVSLGGGTGMTLTPEDAKAIGRNCQPAVVCVAPIVRARTQVVYGNKNWVPLYIYGTTPDFLQVREWPLADADSRCFSDHDVNSGNSVCVLGQTVVRELFGNQPPIGETIRVNNHPFTVIGVLSLKGANMMGYDQDDILLAPWRTIKTKVVGQSLTNTNQSTPLKTDPTQEVKTLNKKFTNDLVPLYTQRSATQLADHSQPRLRTNVDQIAVRVNSQEEVPQAIEQISQSLREQHHIRPGQPDDFNVRDMTEMSKALGSTAQLMSGLLLCVALISLVVGGVGIMNIMLVSVTERTKEIGLRMAVGARPRDILRQFLVEAVLLCLMGGTIGILVGRLGSYSVMYFLKWQIEPSIRAVFASVGVSVMVGVLFGFYPAWKASRMDPIEALRYE